MKRQRTTWFIPLITAFLIHISLPHKGMAWTEEEPMVYKNKSDFVCGIVRDQDQAIWQQDMQITFYNNNDFPVMVNNFLLLEPQEGLESLELDKRYLNVMLSPNRGFAIDCRYIQHFFFEGSLDHLTEVKNFVGEIYSKNIYPLEIAMHYKMSSVENPYPLNRSAK